MPARSSGIAARSCAPYTTYTIYWIPAATPALSTSPSVSGTAAVGQPALLDDRDVDELADELRIQVAALQQHRHELRRHRERDELDVHACRRRRRPRDPLRGPRRATRPAPIRTATRRPHRRSSSWASRLVTTAPKLSGTAKVGNSLSVSKGTWTYSPTKLRVPVASLLLDGRCVQGHRRSASSSSHKLTSARRRPQARGHGDGDERRRVRERRRPPRRASSRSSEQLLSRAAFRGANPSQSLLKYA